MSSPKKNGLAVVPGKELVPEESLLLINRNQVIATVVAEVLVLIRGGLLALGGGYDV